MLYLAKGLLKKRLPIFSDSVINIPGITVLVPFRNEAHRIKSLLNYLSSIPPDKFNLELLFVDDHSSDKTILLIKEAFEHSSFDYRVLKLSSSNGKKAALNLGIKEAKYNIIACTDADCKPHENWIDVIAYEFSNEKIDCLIGKVDLTLKPGFFSLLWQQEWKALQALTAATAKLNNPILCNGANLTFRRETFLAINPYAENENFSSGDDIFLLQALKEAKAVIRYTNSQQNSVQTIASSSFIEIAKQKVRWAQKYKAYTDKATLLIGSIISLANFSLVLALILSLFNSFPPYLLLIGFSYKLLLDFFLLVLFKGENLILDFLRTLFLSFFYPFYSVGIALLSLVWKPQWKGRKTIQ